VGNEMKILHTQLSEVKKVTDNLSTKTDNLSTKTDKLSTQVTLLLQHLNQGGANAPPQGHAQAKEQQLPAPSTFDGNKWDTWKPYMEAKIKVDGQLLEDRKLSSGTSTDTLTPRFKLWFYLWRQAANPNPNRFSQP
jgi:hypothetical protein